MFVLDTLDDKIQKCFKLELQAPVVSPTSLPLMVPRPPAPSAF